MQPGEARPIGIGNLLSFCVSALIPAKYACEQVARKHDPWRLLALHILLTVEQVNFVYRSAGCPAKPAGWSHLCEPAHSWDDQARSGSQGATHGLASRAPEGAGSEA